MNVVIVVVVIPFDPAGRRRVKLFQSIFEFGDKYMFFTRFGFMST